MTFSLSEMNFASIGESGIRINTKMEYATVSNPQNKNMI